MDKDKISIRKKIAKVIKEAKASTKQDTCYLCEAKVTKFCNSHSVPQYIMRYITDNGMIIQPTALLGEKNPTIIDREKGIRKSGTFELICNNCDSKYFSDYENEENWDLKPDKKMLSEVAIKNLLLGIYQRSYQINFMGNGEFKNFFYGYDTYKYYRSLDILDYEYDIKEYIKIKENDVTEDIQIVLNEELDFRTPIATQSLITVYKDLNGRIINDVHDINPKTRMKSMHVCVFPLKNKTKIILFYKKTDRVYESILHSINSMSKEQKLKYVNYLIFAYTDNYYFSPKISNCLNDKNLVKLGRENNLALSHYKIQENPDEYQPVTMDEIPNFFDEEFVMNKINSNKMY